MDGLDGYDHWSWHENLEFTHSGWIFDLIIYYTYNAFEFVGIYVLVNIISALIALCIFNTLLKENNNILVSFILTLFAIYSGSWVFTARGQLFSFFIFVLEMYALNGLLERGKKRFAVVLLILPIILANTHDTVWPIYFVIILPYIAEMILNKIKLFKTENSYKIITSEVKNGKLLIIVFVISLFTGLLTPIFGTAYTNMITVMKGVSKDFIQELQEVNIIQNINLLLITVLTIGIIGFTKTKVRLKDLLYIFGFIILALMASRNIYFVFLISIISFANIITEFLKTYNFGEKLDRIVDIITNQNIILFFIIIFFTSYSLAGFSNKLTVQYVDDFKYPIKATEWMLKNIDIDNMRLYNQFNYGSYLELNGIPVFVDSRSGIYCEEFNDTTVMKDYINIEDGYLNYKEVFNKYEITHVLLYNTCAINQYIFYDDNYELIYQDDIFSIYKSNKY